MSTPTSSLLDRSQVAITGAGPRAIVFLHGLGGDQRQWRRVAPQFEDRYQVVLLDLVGAGQSEQAAYDPGRRHSSLQGHADDLLDVLQALALYDVVFVGHSVGAMIGVLAALREPQRFAQLILISPSPRFLNAAGYAGGFEQSDIQELLGAMALDYAGWSEAIAPVMLGAGEGLELLLEMRNSFVSTNPTIAQHFARVTFHSDHRAVLPLVATPSLILQSKHDVIAPLAVGLYMQEKLVDSDLVVLDTHGHCPHLSAPQQTLGAMQDFLHRGW